jgi:hypothetical protein
MQSGAEEEWDDEDWEDVDSDSTFVSDMSVASKMKLAGVVAFVVLLLLCSMIFTNFGFYFGAGSLSLLIDVNEGKDPGDKTLKANIMATSPTFGILAKEGDYTIHFDGAKLTSGKFNVNDEGRGSITIDYETFFVTNGVYTMKVELGSQESTDTVILNRFADSVSAGLTNFDGDYPLDKDSPVIINLQFMEESVGSCVNGDSTTKTDCEAEERIWKPDYINPWVSGTVKIYHYGNGFNEGQGESYWNEDSDHGGSPDGTPVETIQFDINSDGGSYSYSDGTTIVFLAVEIPPYNLNIIIDENHFDTSESNDDNDDGTPDDYFYDVEGKGDYSLVLEFTNDFGEDTSNKDGRSYWKWFHLCETKDDGKCE